MPKLREISEQFGHGHDACAKSFVDGLVKKGLLCRPEGFRGYLMPGDEVPQPAPRKTKKKSPRQPDPLPLPDNESSTGDEFQYIRLGIGEAATIGDVYIGLVHVETDKAVAALEVIAPASMGVLRRDVYSDFEQPQQPGQNEILLRCLEKAKDLMITEIVRLKDVGIQSAGRRGA